MKSNKKCGRNLKENHEWKAFSYESSKNEFPEAKDAIKEQ